MRVAVIHLWRFFTFWLRQLIQSDVFYASATLTLSTLTALVPTVTLLLYLFSHTLVFENYANQLMNYVASLLDGNVFSSILDYLQTIPNKIGNLSLISTAVLAISVISLLATVEDSFNRIWQVREPRRLSWRIVAYLLIVLLGPTTLVTLSSLWTFQIQHFPIVLSYPLFAEIGYALFTLLMYVAVIFLIFKYIPYRYVPASNALLGALITALIIMIYKRVFIFYVSHFSQYELIYGALASIPLFIFYIYILWFTLLAGAVLTESFSYFRYGTFIRQNGNINHFEDSVRILATLSQADKKSLHIQELRQSIRLGYNTLGQLLEELYTLGYIEKNSKRWSLKKTEDTIWLDQLWNSLVIPNHPQRKDNYGKTLYHLLDPALNNLHLNLHDFIQQ